VDVRLLGPCEVVAGGEVLALGGPRQRAVFVVLALHVNETLTTDRLADLVWNGAPPEGARATVQGYVFHLRKALASTPARIVTRRPGYVLEIDPSVIDVHRFEALVDEARAAQSADTPAVAVARYREALALWRGPALVDFAGEAFAQGEAARLEEMRLAATEARIEEELVLGRHALLVAELEVLVREQPLRETLRGQLMRALHGTGRTADALRVYQEGRHELAEQLGIDPGAELQRLERAILVQDPAIEQTPAVRTAVPRSSGHLPAPVTSFVGREHERKEIAKAIARSRLVTLAGTGGIGKTRLALQVAANVRARFVDGVWLADLGALTDGQLVLSRIAGALGVADDSDGSLLDAVIDVARRRECLLVLDGCDRVAAAVAGELDRLLPACPNLRVLVTSREPIGVIGEVLWTVPGLPVPTRGSIRSAAAAVESDAIRLFVERATAAVPEFTLTPARANTIAEICRRLDGLPLALELAAARLRVLSLAEIASRLDDRFRLLGGARARDAHRHTLRATIDWSYDALTDAEQRLFARLSVFAGAFSIERIEALVADHVGLPPLAADDLGDDEPDVLDVLDQLVAKSMVTRVDTNGPARFRLLETMRYYAAECLDRRGETVAVRDRHAAVFTAAVEAATGDVLGPRPPEPAGDRADDDGDDHRAALTWLLDSGDAAGAQRLAAALGPLWDRRLPDRREPRRWFARVLSATVDPTPERLAALVARAYFGLVEDDLDAVSAAVDEGLELAAQLGDERSRGRLLVRAAEIARVHLGQQERAEELARDATEILDAAGDSAGAAHARWRRTLLAGDRGDIETAQQLAVECLSLWEATGDLEHAAGARALLAGLAHDRGDLDEAASLYEQSLASFRRAQEPYGAAQMVLLLAGLAVDRDDPDTAEDLARESLDRHEELNDTRGAARALLVLADAAAMTGDLDRATALAELALSRIRAGRLAADAPLALTSLAAIAFDRGDLSRADALCDEALSTFRAGGPKRHAGPALVVQSRVRAAQGDAAAGAALADEALAVFRAAGDARGTARSLDAAAEAAVAGHQFERAARYLSAARTTRVQAHVTIANRDAAAHRRVVAAVRDGLAGTDFGRAWAEEWEGGVIDLTVGARRDHPT